MATIGRVSRATRTISTHGTITTSEHANPTDSTPSRNVATRLLLLAGEKALDVVGEPDVVMRPVAALLHPNLVVTVDEVHRGPPRRGPLLPTMEVALVGIERDRPVDAH